MSLKEIFTRDNRETKEDKNIRQKEKETAVTQVVKETNKGLERLAVETIALSYISKMENSERIKISTDEDLSSVIQEELQKAQKAAKENPKIAELLLPYLNEALKDPKLQLANAKTLEKQVPISWETILESSNTNIANFKKYIEEPSYENAYNQVFDMMSLSSFQPKTINYEGKSIDIKQEHVTNFQKLIKSQLLNAQWEEIGELDLSSIRLEKVNKESWWNAEKWRLSFYPQGMRVIKFEYKQLEQTKIWYVSFGNAFQLEKDLAKGLEENVDKRNIEEFFEQVPETIDDTNKEKFWDYIDNKWKLVLEAHWGPAALDILFQKKDMIGYLKQWNNLQTTFDSVIKYGWENQWSYCLKLFQWIENDQTLMSAYVKLVIADSKYLWPVSDLLKRQNIVLWLLKSSFFNIEKDTELFTLLSKEKTNLKQALSVAPTIKNKNVVESLQSQVEWFAKMIVNSPLWAGIITLLDSFFGKWGLMKKLGNLPLAAQLDKQFKEKYAITWEQKNVIDSIYNKISSIQNNNSITIQKGETKDDIKEKFIKMWEKKEDKTIMLENLTKNPELLDTKVLSSLFVLENWRRFLKTDSWDIDYNDVFDVEEKSKKEIIKSDVDKKKLESVLSSVITNSKLQDIVLDAHIKLNSWWEYYWKPTQNWIQTEADYAAFVTAYLMWWSKSDGGSSFHYVITETNMPNEKAPVAVTSGVEIPIEKSEFEVNKEKVDTEIDKIIDGKYWTYSFNDDTNPYTYNAVSSTTTPKQDYQENILKPFSFLFDVNKPNDKPKSNFELSLDLIKGTIDKTDIFIHIKNMLVYMQSVTPNKLDLGPSVSENFKNMIKGEKSTDGNKIILSDDYNNKIELFADNGKLKIEYIAFKTS